MRWRGVLRLAVPRHARGLRSAAFLASAEALGPRTQRFAEWIDPQVPVNKTTMARFHGAGNGLVAAEALAAGTTVLEIPRAVWGPVSATHARASAMAGAPHFVEQASALAHRAMGREVPASTGSAVSAAHANALSANVDALVGTGTAAAGASEDSVARGIENLHRSILLTMHLLFEMGDEQSPMTPYLTFMAAAVPVDLSPLFWASPSIADTEHGQRLGELAGTRAFRAARKRAAALAAMHGALFVEGGGPSLEMFLFALTAILSRAISRDGVLFTLVPLLDCLNHHPAPGCVHRVDPESGSFMVQTTRAHAAGEELCISYSDHGNDALLRLYGFTLPDNPHDTLPLPAPEWPVEGVQTAPTMLHARDCARGPIPDDVLELMVRVTGGDVPDAAGRFRRPIERALAAYAGGPDLPRDLSLLQRDDLPAWRRTCVNLRAGEKQILHAALGQLVALEKAAAGPLPLPHA